MDVPVTDLDGSNPEIVISFESFRIFLKSERLKRLKVMQSRFAFRKAASSGRAVQPWEERTNSKGTSAISSWFEQCLGSDGERPDQWDQNSSAQGTQVSPGSSSVPRTHRYCGKTCPRKAPGAFWSGGDQKAYSLLKPKGERFGKTLLTRGEWSKGSLQPCHHPPRCWFWVPTLYFLLVSKKEKKKSVYAKQHILVTPPLPITR